MIGRLVYGVVTFIGMSVVMWLVWLAVALIWGDWKSWPNAIILPAALALVAIVSDWAAEGRREERRKRDAEMYNRGAREAARASRPEDPPRDLSTEGEN